MKWFTSKISNTENPMENKAEIIAATKKFYTALHAVFEGDATLMEGLWSHADDVTYLGPQGGIVKGWDVISKIWKEQSELNLKGYIEPEEMQFFQDGNLGMTQNYEVGKNYINGVAQDVRIRALNIFRKENGEWKMISHQTDLLPFLN